MHQRLVDLLIEKNLKITTAESCTAGLISGKIVDVANASRVFDMAFVTYSNEAKEELIGVDASLIEKYGVVSPEVALDMARKSKIKAKASCSIAVSGIAGPGGGTEKKPVGMVAFGYTYNDIEISEVMYFGNIGRNNVREKTVIHAIERMVEILENNR